MKAISGILVCLVFLVGCHKDPSPQQIPSRIQVNAGQVYELFAGVPISATNLTRIRDVQADGAQWMDANFFCRFYASNNVINSILARGYHPTNWQDIEDGMNITNYTTSFSPKWDPSSLDGKECFVLKVDEKVNHSVFKLVVERNSGLVYGVFDNSVYP